MHYFKTATRMSIHVEGQSIYFIYYKGKFICASTNCMGKTGGCSGCQACVHRKVDMAESKKMEGFFFYSIDLFSLSRSV